ncbi:FAD/NAD(P)-binding domain-containing protein [Wallemia mellicola]|uniref:FAD/NAD(P)-binding domain-containing protein n=1 Tax=Wallemia mellicola TaxID=1708541 RepID=A0A4T0QUI6_9BASI|nr:FAD/NAD(P)-binding domain-containing protein [Wallemia mellicola]TIC28549.1 FAD/NAD(P)-binding domain-containing protein [Wallemia mellicola]
MFNFGSAEKVKNLHPVTEEFESSQYFGPLTPKDTEWATINSNFVAETQTFYSILEDGQCLSVQVVHSHVGFWYPQIQFNFMLYNPTTANKLWKSISVNNFSTPAKVPGKSYDRRSCSADQFTILHESLPNGDESYRINAKIDNEVQIIINFIRPASCAGFKLGDGPEGGYTSYGNDKSSNKRDGYVVHRFWPRVRTEGQVIIKGKLVDAVGHGAFIHAIQGMRANLVARSWNFALFQSDQHGGVSSLLMEFETTDGYGLATRTEGGGGVKVTIGALVAGDKLLSVTGSTTYPGQMPQGLTAAEYRNTIKDQETAYIVPSEVRYVWGGAAIENNKAIRAEMLVNYKNEKEEGVNRGLVEKVDFLAHIPYVVRKAVHVFAKTKPYIYQYLNPSELQLDLPEGVAEATKLTVQASIIIGAGVSGVAMGCKLKATVGIDDFEIYEREPEVGGTWYINNYPGCANDIPIIVYSFSFAQKDWGNSQWAPQPRIEGYIKDVVKDFNLSDHIHVKRTMLNANWNKEKEYWVVTIKNNETGEIFTRTSNILISAHGGLDVPRPIDTPGIETFKGDILRSQRYDQTVDLTGKNVVVIGNACTATQIIGEIAPKVKTLTQFARGKQWFLPKPVVHLGHPVVRWMLKYIPGLHTALRGLVFGVVDYFMKAMYVKNGEATRKKRMETSKRHVKNLAPAKYHDALIPDFQIGAKRRIFDEDYLKSLNYDHVDLIAERPARITENSVVRQDGTEVPADVIIYAIGFDTTTNKFLENFNNNGLNLRQHFANVGTGAYLGAAVAPLPNFFLLGTASPNCASGHNSVIFTSECTANFIIRVIKPIVYAKKGTVHVTKEAERKYQEWIREKHQEMIWETENVGSFYLDNNTGKNTALYPRSHTHYWWSTLIPKDSDFVYENVSKPWLLQFTSKKAMSAYGTALVAGTATWFLA